MALACANCDSHYLIEDYDNRLHYITGYHCGMCGGTKLIEQNTDLPSKAFAQEGEDSTQPETLPEVNTMPHKLCIIPGCKKQVVKDRLCTVHYRAKHGVAPRAHQKSYKKICSVEGCTKVSLTQGVCYQHLTEKYGGVNPYKYPKKKKPSSAEAMEGRLLSTTTPPSSFVEVAPNVLIPKETKVLVDQITALQSAAVGTIEFTLAPPSESRSVTFNYTFTGGKLVFSRCDIDAKTYANLNGTFDDWMFLGAIAAEIHRIAGGDV